MISISSRTHSWELQHSSFLLSTECLVRCAAQSEERQLPLLEKGRFPSAPRELRSRPSPAGRGWRFHAGLSRWHSVSGVSTEPWDSSWVWFGLGLHKLCSLKSRSWAVSRAGRGLGAPSRCWGESAGSWHCQAGAFLFVVHFSPELAAFQQGQKTPKSFVI